jgi:hypothetical protein
MLMWVVDEAEWIYGIFLYGIDVEGAISKD